MPVSPLEHNYIPKTINNDILSIDTQQTELNMAQQKKTKVMSIAMTEELFESLKNYQLERIIEKRESIPFSTFIVDLLVEAVKNKNNKG